MKVYGQLEVAQLENLSSDPSNQPYGRVYFNTTTNQVRYFDGTQWQVLAPNGGSIANVVGSRLSPTAITAAGGVGFTPAGQTINFIEGSNGTNPAAVVVTANPQIAAGTVVGQVLKLIGTSDSYTVELQTSTGLQLSGAIVLGATTGGGRNSYLELFWDGSQWVEATRT